MKKINISLKQLQRRYLNIKDGSVFRSFTRVYKYNPDSKAIMDQCNSACDSKYGNNMSLAQSYMYSKDIYIGYVMKYYRKLRSLGSAKERGEVDLYRYFNELMEMVEFLNEHGVSYWDFHSGNIRVDSNGHPFLLDLDGSDLSPTDEDRHYQCEYLTCFILDNYLGEIMTVGKYIRLLEDRHILSDKAIRYLCNTTNLLVEGIDLPYVILEEINKPEVQNEIKRLIK